jgi:hypothetical protein
MSSASNGVAEPYRSLPLPRGSKCIRLIRIRFPESSTSGNEGPIEASLEVVDLDQSPSFSALSYVWGQPPPTHDAKFIQCGNSSIPITSNCYSALIHLRKKVSNLFIWVDAVCINQKDDSERAHQISLMKFIYPSAAQVYVWLGESSPARSRSMDYLSGLGLVDCFTVDGDTEGEELSKPKVWTAAMRTFFAFSNPNQKVFPYCTISTKFSYTLHC